MFDERFRAYLIQAQLSVGQRIYPEIVPVNPVYPLLVINQPGASSTNHRDTAQQRSVLMLVTKTIKSYSDTSAEAWRVANEVQAAILSFGGSIFNRLSDYETQSKRYVVVTIAQFWSRD